MGRARIKPHINPQLPPIKIDPLYCNLLPPLPDEDRAALATSILADGCRDPLVVWNGVLVDGHNRHTICRKHGIPFRVVEKTFASKAEALQWILDNQASRRNLTAYDRTAIALKIEDAVAAEAKERQRKSPGRPRKGRGAPEAERPRKERDATAEKGKENSPDLLGPGPQTRDIIAQRARVSTNTVAKVKAIQSAVSEGLIPQESIDALRRNEVSINKVHGEVRKARQSSSKPSEMPPREDPKAKIITLVTHEGKKVKYPEPKGKATFNQTQGEGISWASWSWNPVTGCLHGCHYCYAREIATSERFRAAFPAGFTPVFHHERLDAPANTKIPSKHADDPAWRRVFVCSMADLYGAWVPKEWIDAVHESMLASPQWQYILLTKFPSRYVGLDLPRGAWVGASVDEQPRVRLAQDAFRKLPKGIIKWLSIEPLLAPLEFTDLSMFDWIVIGGQTTTVQPKKGRPKETERVPGIAPKFEWVADIVMKAREAGCAVHLKPNLSGHPGMILPDEYPESGGKGRSAAAPRSPSAEPDTSQLTEGVPVVDVDPRRPPRPPRFREHRVIRPRGVQAAKQEAARARQNRGDDGSRFRDSPT